MNETDSVSVNPSSALSWLEINLDAVKTNYDTLRSLIIPGTAFYPVVKADAYGHGAVQVAKKLVALGAPMLCVARIEEALELRNAGIQCRILVFAPPFIEQARLAAKYNLEVVACNYDHIRAIGKAQIEHQGNIPVHVKVDIGMGRLGMQPDAIISFLHECDSQSISPVAIMSHFPCADSPDASITIKMIERFQSVIDAVKASGRTGLIFHVANTAALLQFPASHYDAVRSGISLYGQYPDAAMPRDVSLEPAMSLYSRIVYLKDVATGTPISYCQSYRTSQPARIATIALGYADGLPRHASGKVQFLLHGKFVSQVGRICMDQTMIDVSNVPEATLGDKVLIFGTSDSGTIRAEDMAARFDTIGYEITTRIGKRLPRIYKGK